MTYIVIAIDSSLSLLRCHKFFVEHSYLSFGKLLAKGIVCGITQSSAYNFVSVFNPEIPGVPYGLSAFTNSNDTLFIALEAITEDITIQRSTSNDLCLSLQCILSELFNCCGGVPSCKVIFITDGANSSKFSNSTVETETLDNLLKHHLNLTVFFVSLTDDHLSLDLQQIHSHLGTKSSIIKPPSTMLESFMDNSMNTTEKNMSHDRTENFITQYCDLLLTKYLNIQRLPEASPNIRSDIEAKTIVRCGHFFSTVILLPQLNQTIFANCHDVPQCFYIDVFGFLNISDLSNPPVSSRHCVVSIAATDSTEFLPIMLNSMQLTKTAAMVCIHTMESGSIAPDGDFPVSFLNSSLPAKSFQRYGFLHQFDSKCTFLMLSVFPKDCMSLPWLGQFKYLAPVADFAGAHLYDDQQGISPFPVRVADALSYVCPSTTKPPATSHTQADNPGTFRYVTWLSTSTMATDISKVIRLSRRLPEKSNLFYKELYRVRSAAQAYGCPDLLEQILSAIVSGFSTPAAVTLQKHMDSIRQILSPSSSTIE